jgi:hypothetical protein
MTIKTAKFIIHRHGLSVFSFQELCDLLRDPYKTLPICVKEAIITIKTKGAIWTR